MIRWYDIPTVYLKRTVDFNAQSNANILPTCLYRTLQLSVLIISNSLA